MKRRRAGQDIPMNRFGMRHVPKCFSPPVAHVAFVLNDRLPRRHRIEFLSPLVPLLAGSKRDNATERARSDFIRRELVNLRRHFGLVRYLEFDELDRLVSSLVWHFHSLPHMKR